jgi:hypothetical protein
MDTVGHWRRQPKLRSSVKLVPLAGLEPARCCHHLILSHVTPIFQKYPEVAEVSNRLKIIAVSLHRRRSDFPLLDSGCLPSAYRKDVQCRSDALRNVPLMPYVQPAGINRTRLCPHHGQMLIAVLDDDVEVHRL